MKLKRTVITAGLAMFAMFFGSGNLVFPVLIGVETLDQSPYTALGLFLTGVVVPFIGLISVILYSGDRKLFFSYIGKAPALIVTFVMLALMGPFGVLARCIVVAYGGIGLIISNFPFPVFSVLFCLLTALLIWAHDKIIPILGRLLTPWLIIGIASIIVMGFWYGEPAIPSDMTPSIAFNRGLMEGYQIMDLLAAFFFAATAVGYINVHLKPSDSPKLLGKLSTYASFIAAVLLGFVYIAFVILGARYAPQLEGLPSEQLLASIAGLTMGPFAIPVMSVTIALACLTTATVLTTLFAEFLSSDLSRGKMSRHPAIIVTLVIAFFVSMLGFESIRGFLGTILKVAYPALIALAVANIIRRVMSMKFNLGGWSFWSVAVISTVIYIF